MDRVEDFADFLIDAELNSLPVLKRACEGYLCSELCSVSLLRDSTSMVEMVFEVAFSLVFLDKTQPQRVAHCI